MSEHYTELDGQEIAALTALLQDKIEELEYRTELPNRDLVLRILKNVLRKVSGGEGSNAN